MRTKPDPFEDSIIGDVRRARAAFWAKFGNDPKRVLEHFRKEQAKEPHKYVNLHRRKTVSGRTLD